MEEQIVRLTLALIRSAISGTALSDEERELCTAQWLRAALKLSASHDLAHLVSFGIKSNGLTSLVGAESDTHVFKAVYRHQQMKFAYDKLCETLEKSEIPFLPLKGAVIRSYYPEPWMRTSCDVDVLVKKEDMDRVHTLLVDTLGYKYENTYSHDASYFAPGGVHIEMHFDLIEEGIARSSAKALRGVWSGATVKDGYKYWYEMSDSTFYLYHIAHMAKHLLNGGCGIKPFIDLFILDRIEGADKAGREELLERGDLLKFTEGARLLSEVWLGSAQHTASTLDMQHYVLSGGVYGSDEHRTTINIQKSGSKLKHILSLFFLPYDRIKYVYPILQKHRWLTPVMQVRRWIRIVLRGNVKRATDRLAMGSSITNEDVERVNRFLGEIGLL